MSRKKIFAAGLLVSLLLTGTAQTDTVFAAAPSLSASADTGSVSEGDYVNIDVELGNNPDISTLGASLNYDSSVLKYDSSTWNSGFSGSDMQMASDTGSEVNLSVVCDDSYSADGTVVSVRFQAVKDSDSIPVTLSLRDMADADLSEISDCTVASKVRAPQTGADSQAGQTAENNTGEGEDSGTNSDEPDMVDLDHPGADSDVQIVDEEAGQPDQLELSVSDTSSGTQSESGIPAGMSQGAASKSTVRAAAPQGTRASSKPDANYKTGIGFGSDVLIIGAAVFGILALVLVLRGRRKEDS